VSLDPSFSRFRSFVPRLGLPSIPLYTSVILTCFLPLAFTEYVCPKCGHFNASANSKKSGSISTPTSPDARSPTAIPSRLRPDRGSAFVPPLGASIGTQDSASRAPTRLRDELEEERDRDRDNGNASVMEVDS